ncbi:hypothetical protein MSAN_02203500 [Mycena sanguinolenta]|uniref:Uncharacterized protein n=1 Tax=Mycena sanguinolenta TaxID=230812 RepID=A0A8H6XCI0_9AGAR|nr:hypothetical protein MSAN_02203500 [Mycena sanguinolenta]
MFSRPLSPLFSASDCPHSTLLHTSATVWPLTALHSHSPALNTPRTLHHTIFLEYVHVFDDVGYYVAAVQCPPRLPLFILSPSGARRALYLRHPPRLFNASHATFSPRRSLNT